MNELYNGTDVLKFEETKTKSVSAVRQEIMSLLTDIVIVAKKLSEQFRISSYFLNELTELHSSLGFGTTPEQEHIAFSKFFDYEIEEGSHENTESLRSMVDEIIVMLVGLCEENVTKIDTKLQFLTSKLNEIERRYTLNRLSLVSK